MIYFLTLLCSMCIQFATIEYPYNVSSLNSSNYNLVVSLLNTVINSTSSDSWEHSHSSDVLNHLDSVLVIRDSNGYNIIYPIEVADPNYNSTMQVTSRNSVGDISVRGSNIAAFFINSNGSFNRGELFIYGTDFNIPNALVYTELPFPFSSVDTFAFNYVPELSGHSQSGKNDKILDPLPFPNSPTITGHSSVSTVDDTNTNNLLGNILNSIQIVGNSITSAGNNIITFLSDLYGNINSTINYFIEPLDHEEVIDIMKNSHYNGLFEDLKNVKDSFDNLSNTDHVILSFTLPAYLGGNTYSFDFAQYFNSSKHIWQPLLLTFLYASLVWGFYKGFANMVNGSSPFVSDVHYQFANNRIQREQASDNHTR